MSRMTDNKITDAIAEHLAKYRELAATRHDLEQRLGKVEEQKDSVKPQIYEKVRADYDKQLEKLSEDLAPLEEKVVEARQAVDAQLQKLDLQVAALRDELEECEFRHRVDEFDDDALTNARRPIEQKRDGLERRREALADALDELTLTNDDAAAADEPFIHEDRIAPPSDDVQTERSVETTTETLVNTDTWVELVEDNEKEAPIRLEKNTELDPIAHLADPSDEASARSADTNGEKERSAGFLDSYPVLTIINGPGAGKKIPLGPMTMAVGREHDNNIELEDGGVARYHARITFEKGDYILKDLATPSGTWVNDERITEVTLGHGDKIRFGNIEMLIDFQMSQ